MTLVCPWCGCALAIVFYREWNDSGWTVTAAVEEHDCAGRVAS